jgi:hypothetical protein
MNLRLRRWRLAAAGALLILLFGCASSLAPLGKRPAHLAADPDPVENDQAIAARIWAPGIDDGYVPQGIAFAEGRLLLSSYRSTDPKQGRGPCRVYRIDVGSGRVEAQFDMPAACGHAGGLAYAGNGMLIVADTRRLYKIDMARAFADGDTAAALRGTITLSGAVKGSFAAFDGKSILIGASEKQAEKARAYYLPYSLFDRAQDIAVDESAATKSFAIGTDAQGAGFDSAGGLWLSFSNSRQGRLQRIDAADGAVLASYQMVIGLEDLDFDGAGRLWTVSEAGSLRWSKWSKRFPVIFSIDPGKLK